MNIKVENLTKKIGRAVVLDNINYIFEGGHIYGLSGKNGCGKTMLMRCISGLIYPTEGRVIINDEELGKDISFPRSIGVLIENPIFLPSYTGFENLSLLAGLQKGVDDDMIKDAISRVGLDPDDKRKFRKYSLGMKQRLGIAAAMMNMPEVLILDEPINAIDESGVKQVRDAILDFVSDDRIIIIACHDRDELEYLTDVIIYMDRGRIK